MTESINSDLNDLTLISARFLKIIDGQSVFYGGDQAWFNMNKNGSSNGCAPVAAANLLMCLAAANPQISSLFSLSLDGYDISKQDYLKFMEEVYLAMNPPVFGIWGLNTFIRRVLRYAASKGITLNIKKNSIFNNSVLSFKNFIKSALEQNIPVALFETLNVVDMQYMSPYTGLLTHEKFSRHWVTVTEIEGKRRFR